MTLGDTGETRRLHVLRMAEPASRVNERYGDFTLVDNEDTQWTPHTLGCNIAKRNAASGVQLGGLKENRRLT